MDVFDKAHLGAMFVAKNKFVFKRTTDKDWCFGMSHLKESAVIYWPLSSAQLPGKPKVEYFFPRDKEVEPNLMKIFDIKDMVSRQVGVKSWARQRLQYGNVKTIHLHPAIRIYAVSEVMPA